MTFPVERAAVRHRADGGGSSLHLQSSPERTRFAVRHRPISLAESSPAGRGRRRATVAAWVCAAWFVLLSLAVSASPSAERPGSLRILCYHDVRDGVRATEGETPEPEAVDTAELDRQFAWLRSNGYSPISLTRLLSSRAGGAPLPSKPVLLTFDDGFLSLYTRVFPLLRKYRYPAVAALVTGWLETPVGRTTDYGDQGLPRAEFVTWDEVRRMVSSGLVEVASHTHHMHRGVPANPQGNQIPAAVTRRYLADARRYESEQEYRARVAGDLAESVRLISGRAGVRPQALVWPYGEYDRGGLAAARGLGLLATMNLEGGLNEPDRPLDQLKRIHVPHGTALAEFARLVSAPTAPDPSDEPIERVVHVDLDYVYDPIEAQQEANLSKLVDRIAELGPSTVYLQAFADPDGDGVADAAYFPNRRLPLRADLFSRAAWQLRTRANVRVYAWMPVLAFRLPGADPAADDVVTREATSSTSVTDRYRRLSPFSARARAAIREIYEDLGRSSNVNGLLFHDDAILFDDEDASAAAVTHYRTAWRLRGGPAAIRARASDARRWAKLKTDYLDDFTLELAEAVRQYRPALLTARNLYADTVLDAGAEARLGQSFERAVRIYDFASVMAMPYLEGARDPRRWLETLVERVKTVPGALPKTVFELQSRDWNSGRAVPARVLADQMNTLLRGGARSYGYYPDDFVRDEPAAHVVKHALTQERYP